MPKRKLTAIRLDKIAVVDKPCQQHAVAAVFKHAPKNPGLALAKATFEEALEGQLITSRVNQAFYQSFDGLWERNDAFRTALTDELAEGGDGSTASAAYVASVTELVNEAVSEARDAGKDASEGDLAKCLETAVDSWLSKKNPKEQTMKILNKAQLLAAISAFAIEKSTVADVQAIKKAAVDLGLESELPADGPLAVEKADPAVAKMQRELAELKMPADVRKHYDELSDDDKTAFLAKSDADRATEVEAIQKGDPVVYTCTDGSVIRKSDGAAASRQAERADKLEKRLDGLTDTVTSTTLEKRAVLEFPNVAKSLATAMLKSVGELGDDSEAGKAVMKSLTQMNKATSHLFKSLGSTEGGDETVGDIKKAREDFGSKVADIQKRDSSDRASAMSKARIEHSDLFKEAYPDASQNVDETEDEDA